MIALSYISSTLTELDRLYNKSTSQKKAVFYSKLALIELCGWVEETLDDIILRHAYRHLKDKDNKNYCKNRIVKPNYGFEYNKNIRPMLISLVGLIEVEKLELELEKNALITLLKGHLGNIKESRNIAAHTHVKGITKRFNAPSRTIGDFERIKPILLRIDKELRKM
jgi:hypothetical protein